jgi:hypothetical protein
MRATLALAVAWLGLAAVPALAQMPDGYGQAFVDGFARVCLPERLSFAGTKMLAETQGWEAVADTAQAELSTMLGITDGLANNPQAPILFEHQSFRGVIADREVYLVVSRTRSVPFDGSASMADIGCYLYDFDADAAIAPEPVTDLLGTGVAQSYSDYTITAYLWGPPPALPRTGDTYLGFIPEGSVNEAMGGFSGLVLRFTTSEPDGFVPLPEPPTSVEPPVRI